MIDNTQPLHNLLGRIIDVSLIWELFYDDENKAVTINGHKVAYLVEFEDYKELEKHFIGHRRDLQLQQPKIENEELKEKQDGYEKDGGILDEGQAWANEAMTSRDKISKLNNCLDEIEDFLITCNNNFGKPCDECKYKEQCTEIGSNNWVLQKIKEVKNDG